MSTIFSTPRHPWAKPSYQDLPSPSAEHDSDDDEKLEEQDLLQPSDLRRRRPRCFQLSVASFAVMGILCLATGLALGYLAGERHDGHNHQENKVQEDYCAAPSTRREWSTLSFYEKSDYIHAVRCMSYGKSKTRPDGALYDDFPYVRAEHGRRSIDAASFLPWNRYFLHVYEKTLRESCRYKGALPYWAWSLSWKSLADHPVFAKTVGFGGDGNPTASMGRGGGRCVLDGSFSDLELKIIDGTGTQASAYSEHCLSRGFADGDKNGHLAGAELSPETIRDILDQPDFESFLAKLQAGPMTAIPGWVNGHFSQLTGPNDPLFILHLAQLDRLWWIWQMIDPYNRNEEYKGLAWNGSDDRAGLQDVISLGSFLAPDVKAEDVMATNYGGVLCYNYTIS